jgi:hypothetical protein
MASTKRAREDTSKRVVPLADHKAIKASIRAAIAALDWRALDNIAEQLEEESTWLARYKAKVDEEADAARPEGVDAAICDALEAAAHSLPPGGAVATFNTCAVDEVFKGPFGQRSEPAFARLDADIRVAGIPVKMNSRYTRILDTVQETFNGLTCIGEKWPDVPASDAVKAAAKDATVTLLKSTRMKEVIHLGKDPEYNGEGLQEHEFLVSVTVPVSFIFAKAVTRF